MNIIVNVAKNWAIGKDGELLVHLKEDMRFFREKTIGNVVIMGRRTLESFPKSKPLPDRINIVITRNVNYQPEGVIVVHSVKEALDKCREFSEKEIFVIGGETIYRQMLDYCDTAYITKVNQTYDADTYFPDLDKEDNWEIVEKGEEKEYSQGTFCFTTYKKIEK